LPTELFQQCGDGDPVMSHDVAQDTFSGPILIGLCWGTPSWCSPPSWAVTRRCEPRGPAPRRSPPATARSEYAESTLARDWSAPRREQARSYTLKPSRN
jgi:hypothetical protein